MCIGKLLGPPLLNTGEHHAMHELVSRATESGVIEPVERKKLYLLLCCICKDRHII